MKLCWRPTLIVIVACFLFLVTVEFVLLVFDAQAAELPVSFHSSAGIHLSPNVPINPELSLTKSRQVVIDDYAWQLFVALNWPADCRTQQPLGKIIGQAPYSPRAWEFYRSPDEIFLPQGQDPSRVILPEPQACLNDAQGTGFARSLPLRLTETGKMAGESAFGQVAIASDDDLVSKTGELRVPLETVDIANEIPLVDQSGNYVINEIYVNSVEFEQILNQGWYDAHNLQKFNNDDNPFNLLCSGNVEDNLSDVPCSDYSGNEGPIEIKVGWRIFGPDTTPQEKRRYYITKRKLAIPANLSVTGGALTQEVEVGLIGFHIVQKTSGQGWIWATFEQVDNIPGNISGSKKIGKYTLNNPACSGRFCQANMPYVREPFLWQQKTPHAVTRKRCEVVPQIPTQMGRINPISLISEQQTQKWQAALSEATHNSVWQHYQLVGTEWLSNPQVPFRENLRGIEPSTSRPLANVALEPYVQNVSCIVCHTSASLPSIGSGSASVGSKPIYADFSFLLRKAQHNQLSAIADYLQ